MLAAVTGAGGHLGGVVVRGLIEAGYDVRAIDLHHSDTLEGLDVDFVTADVLAFDEMTSALADVDVVCHLAALISVVGDRTGMVARVNGEGPGVVADAALEAGVRRMVHCSSVHAFDLSAAKEPLTEIGMRSVSNKLPAYDQSGSGNRRSSNVSGAVSTRSSSTQRGSSDRTTSSLLEWVRSSVQSPTGSCQLSWTVHSIG